MAKDKNKRIEYKLNDFLTEKIINDEKNKVLTISIRDIYTLKEIREIFKIDLATAKKILKKRKIDDKTILDNDQIAEIVMENNYDLKFEERITPLNVLQKLPKLIEKAEFYKNIELEEKPPIITIMGHVDHGKTTLLDYIKKTNVVASEEGGITQKIGAYTIEQKGKKITFIDTPGHEAFTQMRANGSQITDIAIIVVAADDSLMPQTKESIDHAKAANVPIIIVVNKIDKPNVDFEKILNELSDYGLSPEQWGGDIPVIKISALTGENVDHLIDTILLQAELLELKSTSKITAYGTVIESNIDKKLGSLNSVIINNGSLKSGDLIFVNNQVIKIKAMYDSTLKKIDIAGPSDSVELYGLGVSLLPGSKFSVVKDQKDVKKIISEIEISKQEEQNSKKVKSLDDLFATFAKENNNVIKIILKANSKGPLDAIKDQLLKIKKPHGYVEVIHSSVGDVTNSDISLAKASKAFIFTFAFDKVNPTKEIKIHNYKIIYELIEHVENLVDGFKEPEIIEEKIGKIELIKLFESSKFGTILGSIVKDGKINSNSIVKFLDGNEEILFTSKIKNLKIEKNNVKEVGKGKEFGLTLENNDFKFIEGQTFEIYEKREIKNEK